MGPRLCKGYQICKEAKEADLGLVLIHCEGEII